MTDIKPENRAFFWATIFLRALQQSGIKHIVISPGSRSTPLSLAAAALPRLKKHVILDERSAAYFALGIGKATTGPAALICTSGTAVANYYPAVIEARMSGVPLLLLTADRPPHLRETGANQSINQQKIFGRYPVFFQDAGEPVLHSKDINRLQKLAKQSYAYSRSRQGPAHLNFPFRKPLEPSQDFVHAIVDKNRSHSYHSPAKFPDESTKSFRFDDDLLYEIHAPERSLIIVGQLAADTSLDHIFKLAEGLEAPVLSEQGIVNSKYAIQGFEGFLRNEKTMDELNPDLILRFGRQPASKSLLTAIKHWQPDRHIHFSDTEQVSDIANTTTDFIQWNEKYIDTHKFPKKAAHWLQSWKQMEETYFKNLDQVIADFSTLTDGHVYHHLVPSIPEHWSVFVSNSFPARDRSMFGCWKTQRIFTNRGASGIDGITSTAMGVATGLNQPLVLFTGDLAFLHDTNALLNLKELNQPMVVVVINNQGGSIFRMLPIVNHDKYFSTYFETPQNAEISVLAKAYKINYTLVSDPKSMDETDISNFSEPGLHIIECKTNPDTSMKLRKKLWHLEL